MKSYTEYLLMYVPTEFDFINITPRVAEAVAKSRVIEGLCLVSSMHLSASIFVHHSPEALFRDQQRVLDWIGWLGHGRPQATGAEFFGQRRVEEPLDPQQMRQLLGRETMLAITRGRLDLGSAEQVFYGEFDGGREKRVLVKIIGDESIEHAIKEWDSRDPAGS